MKKFLITMDPGQRQDPAAVQIYRAEPLYRQGEPLLGQPTIVIVKDDLIAQYSIADKRYTYLTDFVMDLLTIKEMVNQTILGFDCTGVGQAVKDMLYDKGVVDMIPINYTSGGRVNIVYRDTQDKRFKAGESLDFHVIDQYNVPKADLVDAARLCLEQGDVRIRKGIAYRDQFENQLMRFRGKMTAKGYTSYNNDTDETHDDFANCFFMRCWIRQRMRETILKTQNRLSTTQDETVDILSL